MNRSTNFDYRNGRLNSMVLKILKCMIFFNNLTVIKADKGNSIEVLNADDNLKMSSYIENDNFTKTNNNINTFNNRVKSILKSSNNILDDDQIRKLSANC